ncbi:methyl-accepting chemotaxis protein [Vibrio cholerae]|uniref:Methyl-accepting chemotaxis protein n=2 Tax=Vibrio TaxID=662 RepID=A0A1X1LH25_VIBCL|nr:MULTISPECIES: methyl-accepting chemotaxis protein [Vibrio]ATD28880.1 Methyl-accepting chemotaxis protein HylB [Vibrio cholerae]AYC06816.1 Methyl-accepting chemotaxis protein, hemolysin secretion protein HylB [Vibrio cholerae]EGQ8014841.1 methyl-accepting chemotaxis protein [Vibrio cholerae]EGQ8358193.1 HAMP domain-containing protein [Vibrio cholerae]EGQ8493468.1 HAMP domain-containing protein [Vibrio cholerae]
MIINKFSLKWMLAIAVAIPAIALLFVAFTSLNTMSVMQAQSNSLYANTAAPMRAMAEATSRIPRMRVGIDMMLLQETALKDAKGVLKRVEEARTEDIPEMRQAMQVAVDSQVNPELKEQARKLQVRFEQMVREELEPMLQAFANNDMTTAQNIYRDKYAPTYGEMRKQANQILDTLLQQAEQQNHASVESFEAGRTKQMVIIAAGLIISFITSLVIITNLRSRVAYLKDRMSSAAANLSLRTRLELDGNDELCDIGKSFNAFIDKVHHSIEEVAENSKELAMMASSVSQRAHMTQSNCASQRDRTVQVATAIHELGATVSEIASNAAMAADVAKQATLHSGEGKKVVGEVQNRIQTLVNELDNATQVVSSLATQINGISSTLDTIRSISEQTNLLALNAAIEAARAGEQGRGFAVVADEVRTLASRSAASTEEIQQVINRLQTESSRAVEAMEKGRSQSDVVVEFSAKANQSLTEINSQIDQINDQNIQVATATEEQSTVVEDINRNVEDINQLTTETSHVADELSRASASLQRLSSQLDKLVGSFEL